MGLKYYFEEVSPLYANTSISYPSPPSLSAAVELPMIKLYNDIVPSTHLKKNIYANIPILSPKPSDISSESSYTTLLNATSITSSPKMRVILDENNNRLYENIDTRPTSSSTINSYQKTSLNNVNLTQSAPIYMNLEHEKDPSKLSDKIKQIKNTSIDHETNILEKNVIQTVKKLEINMAPNCGDKSVLYRTKLPTQIRRTLHHSRRHRRRNSTPFRTTHQRRQQQQQHSSHKTSPMKSVSNKLYQIQGELFEYPVEIHGLLQHQIISWYPMENYNEEQLIPQVFSASENGESNHQDEIINEEQQQEEEKEEEEEEEELFPHDTFEDFLLRRPTKSSSSSDTSTIISKTVSYELPIKVKTPTPPPPPPLPINRRLHSTELRLDKNDVDFIQNIIQRTQGDNRVSNRIAALREAYLRAETKRNDLQKTTKKKAPVQHSFIASKIRHELERYDELPIHRRVFLDDDDDDDDTTYSANDDHRFYRRKLPPTPSTGHRILNFLTTLKRQLQKNFQEIRSRILIETMTNPPIRHRYPYHNSSGVSHRHVNRSKILYKTNSHQSMDYSYPIHRQQLYRTHSNMSQLQVYRPRTFRVTPNLQRRQRT